MRLTVNGIEQEISSPPLTALLHVLREELEITSPKAGCQQGGCGTCTVLVDGEPRRSCLTPVAVVDGAAITTLEGLGEAEALSPLKALLKPVARTSAILEALIAGVNHGRGDGLLHLHEARQGIAGPDCANATGAEQDVSERISHHLLLRLV